MKQLSLHSTIDIELLNITTKVAGAVRELGVDTGHCHVFVPHTTAAVVINEAADPDVAHDLAAAYRAMVPDIRFRHAEGNSAAHLMSTVLGSSVLVPVVDGRLALGTWQGIFFVELDGPRTRSVRVTTL